jgi:carboxylate-amine ligase
VLSVSAASPYLDGAEAGARSGRAGRIAELPRASVPPLLPAWSDYEALRQEPGFDRMWWDVRPHPDLGTLELRIADMQTDVRRSAALGALCQALVAAVLERPADPLDRDVYARRREEGAREALGVEPLADVTERHARRLGGWALVEELLASPAEAVRQLELGASGDLQAVVTDLADRTPP